MAQIPADIGGFTVPSKLRYIPKPVGITGERVIDRIEPDGANKKVHCKATGSRQSRILTIPRMDGAFLDPEQVRISWDSVVYYDGTEAADHLAKPPSEEDNMGVIPPDGQYGYIYSLRIKSGSSTLAYKENYNRLHTFMKKANMNKEYYDTIGTTEGYWGSFLSNAFRYGNQIMNIQQGDISQIIETTDQVAILDTTAAGVVVVRNAQPPHAAIDTTSVLTQINKELIVRAGTNTRYSLHPHILLFDLPKAIHLGDFPSGLTLEIVFENPLVALSTQNYASYMTGYTGVVGATDANRLNITGGGTDLTSRSYVIDNLALEIEYVKMDDAFVALWNQIRSESGHSIHFNDWSILNKSYTSGYDTILPSVSNVKSAYVFFQGANQVNGDRGNSLDKYVDMNIQNYKFRYGKLTLPMDDGVVYEADLINYNYIAESLKALGKYSDIDGGSIINYKDPATLYNTGDAITDSDGADVLNGKDFFLGCRFTPFVNDDSYTLDTGTLSLYTKQHSATTSNQFTTYVVIYQDKIITFDSMGGVGVSE